MSSQQTTVGEHTSEGATQSGEHGGSRLGWFLCWAVVFADLGTSVYYTPGILYGQVGRLAGLFVTMTLVVFLLLTLKYAEVSVRFPEGGGVVTVAARGINPWAGAVGGMFILVDYFLTSAISSLSGLQYFTDIVPGIAPIVLPLTIGVIVALGVLNWWGIKESATVSAVIAVAALLSDAAILILVFVHVPFSTIVSLFGEMFHGRHLGPGLLLTGFAGAFLAFSGLESISQLSPVMRAPRRKTVRAALAFVVITVGISSPLLTIFSTMLLNAAKTDPNKFISQLGGAYGGDALKIVTAISASALLVFASNTAIIGAYHVFLALSRMQFFPKVIETRNAFRDTPHVAIAIATGIPILVLIAVKGRIDVLGDMYAFGLLGAFSLTCIALDVMRMRERRAGVFFSAAAEDEAHALIAQAHGVPSEGEVPPGFGEWMRRASQRALSEGELGQLTQRLAHEHRAARDRNNPLKNLFHQTWPHAKYYLGFVTTVLVSIAWITNLYAKPLATMFGGALTIIGVGVSVINFRRQTRIGLKPIFPERTLMPMPDSVLVLLPSGSPENADVVRAAIASAQGRALAFLGLGSPYEPQTRSLMQITDAYFHDEEMKRLFALADAACEREHIPHRFFYRMKAPNIVPLAWRTIDASEVVAAADLAHEYPDLFIGGAYVRKHRYDGVTVAHHIRRRPTALESRSRGAEAPSHPPARPTPEPAEPDLETETEEPAWEPPTPGESTPRFKKVLNPNSHAMVPPIQLGGMRRRTDGGPEPATRESTRETTPPPSTSEPAQPGETTTPDATVTPDQENLIAESGTSPASGETADGNDGNDGNGRAPARDTSGGDAGGNGSTPSGGSSMRRENGPTRARRRARQVNKPDRHGPRRSQP